MTRSSASAVVLISALLISCGGEYESDSVKEEWIQRECLDWNDNLSCDTNELGNNSAQQSSASVNKILEEISSQSGNQRSLLLAPADSSRVDALTSLLWNELANNPFVSTTAEAKNYLSQKLGIDWNIAGSSYVQQNNIVLERIAEAQELISDNKLAISALAETMLAERSLNVAVDQEKVPDSPAALSLLASIEIPEDTSVWNYSAVRQQLVVVTEFDRVVLFDSRNNFSEIENKAISSGVEFVPSSGGSSDDNQSQSMQAGESSALTIDAFASATDVVTPPVVTPPPPPPTVDPGDVPATRALNPLGDISQVFLGQNFANVFVLTTDESNTQEAQRACNHTEANYGVFKLNVFDPVAARAEAGCNQRDISAVTMQQDGRYMLVQDSVARRIYWVDSKDMREASQYYLRLNSDVTHVNPGPENKYSLLAEQQGRKTYMVRLNDMQVIADFGFSGDQIKASRWLNGGREVVVFSDLEWQRWDVQAAHFPVLLDQGAIDSTLAQGEVVAVSGNGEFYARLSGDRLSLFRIQDNRSAGSIANVEEVFWQASDLVVKTYSEFSRFQLKNDVNNDLQRAQIYLTDARILSGNKELNNVTSDLNLPATIPGTGLNVSWSGTISAVSYDGTQRGKVTPSSSEENGIITATINSSFRGDAVRWTKNFNVTIKTP